MSASKVGTPRKSVRTPPDHQLNSTGRSNVTSSTQTDQSSQSYGGDSEEDSRERRHEKSCSSMDHVPQQQHIRHVIKPLVMNSHHNRHYRGCVWGESEKVTLLVDDKRFMINPNLLIKHPNTMLGR